jgi:hypothetical protein
MPAMPLPTNTNFRLLIRGGPSKIRRCRASARVDLERRFLVCNGALWRCGVKPAPEGCGPKLAVLAPPREIGSVALRVG